SPCRLPAPSRFPRYCLHCVSPYDSVSIGARGSEYRVDLVFPLGRTQVAVGQDLRIYEHKLETGRSLPHVLVNLEEQVRTIRRRRLEQLRELPAHTPAHHIVEDRLSLLDLELQVRCFCAHLAH